MTSITRRAALQAGFAGLAAASIATGARAGAATSDLYARSRWAALLNKPFTMVSAHGRWTATLVRITDLKPVRQTNDPKRFLLTFRLSADGGPDQGVHSFRRTGFTNTPVFVVPAGSRHRVYYAVIDRSV